MDVRQRHDEAVRPSRAVHPRWPAAVALLILAVLVSRAVNTLAAA